MPPPLPARTAPSRVILALTLALALAGCEGSGGPVPTPADFSDLSAALSRHGITLEGVVSGEAGCADQELARTAKRVRASGLDQQAPATVYIYMFRDRTTFERLRPAVDACARSYVADPSTYATVAVSPFVAAGQGPWGARFTAALQAGLSEAAGTGG
ncbi:MAG TPA: hypothetical protein VF763_06145 [Candidatus Limnocylindrales bacterium]